MKNKKVLILTALVILSPIVAGLLLWSRLPEQVAIHFNAAGEADGWGSRAMAVFSIPLVLLAGQLLIVFGGRLEQRIGSPESKAMQVILWLLPVLSVVVNGVIYCKALEIPVDAFMIVMLLLGCFFVVMGNVMPKAGVNAIFGIRIPTTMKDPENWRATHRLGGWCMTIGGLLMILAGLLRLLWLYFAVAAAVILIPILYSIVRYSHERHQN